MQYALINDSNNSMLEHKLTMAAFGMENLHAY